MKVKINLLIMFVLFLNSFLSINKTYADNHENRALMEKEVSSVVDLETIKVEQDIIVKLYGVNQDYYREYLRDYKADSLFQTETGVTAGSTKAYFKGESVEQLIHRAQVFYEKLLLGKRVYVEEIPGAHSFIVYLDRNREVSLNQLAVQLGFLVVSENYDELPDLLIKQEEARIAEAGLWDITVYRKDAGVWGESNFVYFAFNALIFNFILCIFFYLYYIRSRSFVGMIALYATWLTTTFFASGIYFMNDKQLYFWAPPSTMIILSLLGISEFILFIRSKEEKGLLFITIKMFLFVMLVIISFSVLYQGYSSIVRKQTELSYSLPELESGSNNKYEEPYGNYITVPEDEYRTLEIEGVRYADRVNNNYQLGFISALYFSATTFFTVGYGDYSPKGFLRIVSVIQMFIGYLSQVVLFSLVVSKIASPRAPALLATNANEKSEHETLTPLRKNTYKKKKRANKYVEYLVCTFIIIENLYIWMTNIFAFY